MATSVTAAATAKPGAHLVLRQGHVIAVVAFAVVHIVLAFVLKANKPVATIHAIATFGTGIIVAVTTRRLRNIGVIAAYIVGCEVLWRMSKANVFWESGKYAAAAVMLIALMRVKWDRNRVLALTYFGLLLPSVAMTAFTLDAEGTRQQVSFYLSGPFSLTVAVLFFSNVRFTTNQTVAMFVALLGPILGICALAFVSTIQQTNIEFVNASTAATSGGYAANQVSAVLGLGVMLLLLMTMTIERGLSLKLRVTMFGLAALLAAQTTLTFARGGLVLALSGSLAAMFLLLRGSRRARTTVIVVALLSTLLAVFVIEPKLESVTKGELTVRYTESSSTGRDRFVASELRDFRENPILGVGPGVGRTLREQRREFDGASHTEYTRMLGEHGLLGLLAMVCLAVLGYRAIKSARTRELKAHATAMVIWTALFLSVYGMRLAAPSFVFGLAFLQRPVARQVAAPTARPPR